MSQVIMGSITYTSCKICGSKFLEKQCPKCKSVTITPKD